jgi:hypothetical protein
MLRTPELGRIAGLEPMRLDGEHTLL